MSARVPKATLCLWYDHNAEDAAKFYAQTFPGSSVGAVRRAPRVYPNGKEGDALVVEFTVLGTYLKTDEGLPPAHGQKYRLPGGAFFDIRDGKVARVTNYYNLQDWLKQVGA